MARKLKLTIELVPGPSWHISLYTMIPRSAWKKIRKETLDRFDHGCGICGVKDLSPLTCHEIWKYDDKHHIQRLTAFIVLCELCHLIKHLGLAGILAEKGKLDYDRLVDHFMKVNACNRKEFLKHKEKMFHQWKKRSQHEWIVDLGEYQKLVTDNEKLRGIPKSVTYKFSEIYHKTR